MKYCTHCGKQVKEEAVVCTECGCQLDGKTTKKTSAKSSSDINSILIKVAPIIGLVLICMGALHMLTSLIYWIAEVAHYAFDGFTRLLGNGLLTYLRMPLIEIGLGLLLYLNNKK